MPPKQTLCGKRNVGNIASMKVQRKYAEIVAQGGPGVFFRLLALWQGSLYKLVWVDLVQYLVIFFSLSFIYRFGLSTDQQKVFEDVVSFCQDIRDNTNITFIMGFFVAAVITRWWILWESIPILHSLPLLVEGLIEGHGEPRVTEEVDEAGNVKKVVTAPEEYKAERSRQLRFHMMRYVVLGWTLGMIKISEQLMVRFNFDQKLFKQATMSLPPEKSAAEKGENAEEDKLDKAIQNVFDSLNKDKVIKSTFGQLITPAEMETFKRVSNQHRRTYGAVNAMEYWIPFQWASLLSQKAGLHGFICDEKAAIFLSTRIESARKEVQAFLIHGEIIIPLVYTQVVIIVVHTYFIAQLLSAQFLNLPETIDMYFPIFDVLVFLFLMGWLRVAFCVIGPFGADDADFDISSIMDNLVYRCYDAANATHYPDTLQRAPFHYLARPNCVDDNLLDFLDDADVQLQALSVLEENQRQASKNSAKGIGKILKVFK